MKKVSPDAIKLYSSMDFNFKTQYSKLKKASSKQFSMGSSLKSDGVIRNVDFQSSESHDPSQDKNKVSAYLAGILGSTICGLVDLIDEHSIPISTVIDKQWMQDFIRSYNFLFELEANRSPDMTDMTYSRRLQPLAQFLLQRFRK